MNFERFLKRICIDAICININNAEQWTHKYINSVNIFTDLSNSWIGLFKFQTIWVFEQTFFIRYSFNQFSISREHNTHVVKAQLTHFTKQQVLICAKAQPRESSTSTAISPTSSPTFFTSVSGFGLLAKCGKTSIGSFWPFLGTGNSTQTQRPL